MEGVGWKKPLISLCSKAKKKSPLLMVVLLCPGIGIGSGVVLRFPVLLGCKEAFASLGSDGPDQPSALRPELVCRAHPVSFVMGFCLCLLPGRTRLKMSLWQTAPGRRRPDK